MTRKQLLQLLVGQARLHGFEFRRWFVANAAIPWSGTDHAVEWLARGERSSLLLFSQTFAQAFFRSGERITFIVPSQTFDRVRPGGGSVRVARRAHVRRSSRVDVWKFHLREMAAAAEPLRYIRRYLLVDESLEEAEAAARQTERASVEDPLAEDYDQENLVRE